MRIRTLLNYLDSKCNLVIDSQDKSNLYTGSKEHLQDDSILDKEIIIIEPMNISFYTIALFITIKGNIQNENIKSKIS